MTTQPPNKPKRRTYSAEFKELFEPSRDCRRLNFLREYDNENTKLYP